MNVPSPVRLALPETLRNKLLDFRRRVWTIKCVESVSLAVFGGLTAFLVVYALDRLGDTAGSVRGVILLVALLAACAVPWGVYRWIWRHRRLDQLACLLRRKHPSVGDQLLGIIELVSNEEEQARSQELCQAAVAQVSKEAERRDLSNAVPNPRHRFWGSVATTAAVAVIAVAVITPDAARNAWARYLAPWKDIPRYTFTMLEPLASEQVVPHGESFAFAMRLRDDTVWKPETARIQLGGTEAMEAKLEDGAYRFECAPQLATTTMRVVVGDYSRRIQVEPKLRPELTGVMATVELPEYLQRDETVEKDVRGGAGTFVKGSRARILAEVSRELASATMDGEPVEPDGTRLHGSWTPIEEDVAIAIAWEDGFGLAGQKPFELSLHSRDDEAPAIVCEGLARQKVVLDSETLTFQVRGMDDFGVKVIGIEWHGFDTTMTSKPAQGERVLGSGSPHSEELQVAGTFSAKSLGIEPQPLQVRLFAEDYLPDRERVYSPAYTLYVLSPEDHAIWLTDQLSKWHRHSLDVRDRELQLYETNKQMRDLPATELDDPSTRRAIEKQASAERTNGRRLNRLVSIGEDLVKQASRNDEFGVGHLEKWAEMLQILKDISGNRMPSVSDLLKSAAKAEQLADAGQGTQKSNPDAPMAGQNRSPGGQAGGESGEQDESGEKPAIPSLVDRESSQQPQDPKEQPAAGSKPSGSGRFGLPVTTLVGGGSGNNSCPAGQKMDEAVEEQRDLLNEFEKVAEELNKVLANLEGSTLVKRLKAASRMEYKIGGRIGDSVHDAFGVATISNRDTTTLFTELRTEQIDTMQAVSHIMDDMQAYFERRRMVKFKNVLQEMEDEDVLGGLRDLSDEFTKESGLAMAQCDYWSDTMDRWAEDLVDPAGGGT